MKKSIYHSQLKFVLMFLIIGLIVSICHSQTAVIRTSDKELSTKINSSTSHYLFTKHGRIRMADISEVIFESFNESDAALYSTLRTNKITVLFEGYYPESMMVKNTAAPQADTDVRFNEPVKAAKVLKIVGGLGLSASYLIDHLNTQHNIKVIEGKKSGELKENIPLSIYSLSAVFITIGFIID